MRYNFLILLWLVTFLSIAGFSQTRRSAAPRAASVRTITVISEPKAKVWMDDILRGTTDENGKLSIKPVPAGARKIRVRADGFKEITISVSPAQKGDVKVALTKTTDEAELAFQRAEAELKNDRSRAIEYYRKAIAARPRFPEAQLALARVLYDKDDFDEALKAIAEARKLRPVYPEVTAVEGRIFKAYGEEEKAIAAYNRAIKEGKGFQPEARTGLALLYKERAEGFMLGGDLQNANDNYDLAAKELKTALAQLSGAPDAKDLFQILADIYYRARRYQEAINTYEEFLKVFPDSNEETAVRSLILQTKKEMEAQQ